MLIGPFVAYYRSFTARQGRSLSLDAQRASVAEYLNGDSWSVLADFVEVESGRTADRPQLAAALDYCQLTGANLVIAKLDSLIRDAHFLLGLQKSGVEFIAVDMPYANHLTVGILAVVAEEEARAISARIKAALKVAKARRAEEGKPPLGGFRGHKVDGATGAAAMKVKADGFAASVAPIARQMREDGKSLSQIAAALADRGIRTARGGAWTATAVKNVLARATALDPVL